MSPLSSASPLGQKLYQLHLSVFLFVLIISFPLQGFSQNCQNADDCDDGIACTADNCDNGNCINISACDDDGDPCTLDTCMNGECMHIVTSCDLQISNLVVTSPVVEGCINGTITAQIDGSCPSLWTLYLYNDSLLKMSWSSFSGSYINWVGIVPASYHLIVTDGASCADTVDFIIEESHQPCNIQLDNLVVTNTTVAGCNNGTITAEAGGLFCGNFWEAFLVDSNGFNFRYWAYYYGQPIRWTDLAAGDYQIIVRTQDCADTVEVTIQKGNGQCDIHLDSLVVKNTTIQGCNDGGIVALVGGAFCGNFAEAFLVDSNNFNVAYWAYYYGQAINWSNLAPGDYRIFVHAQDCGDTIDVTIGESTTPCALQLINVTAEPAVLQGCYGTIHAEVQGLICNYSWNAFLFDTAYNPVNQWSSSSGAINWSALAGSYHIVATGGENCSDTVDVSIADGTIPCTLELINVSTTDPVIQGCDNGIVTAEVNGESCQNSWSAYLYDSAYVSYQNFVWQYYYGSPIYWSNVPAGHYHLVVQGGGTCSDTVDITIAGGTVPCSLQISNVQTTDGIIQGCNDGTVTLEISGESCNNSWTAFLYNSDYSDHTGASFSFGNTAGFQNVFAGTYHAVVANGSSCADTVDVIIGEGTTPCNLEISNLGIQNSVEGCAGGFVTAEITGAGCHNAWIATLYNNDNPDNIYAVNFWYQYYGSFINWNGILPGSYFIVVSDGGGCSDTADVVISTVPCGLSFSNLHVTTGCSFGGLTADVSGLSCQNYWVAFLNDSTYSSVDTWQNYFGSPVNFAYLHTGIYHFAVTDGIACATDTVDVYIPAPVACSDADLCTTIACVNNQCVSTPISVIAGFTLVNASTDIDMGALHDGDIINLHDSPPFTIRADVARPVGSVKFQLNGAVVRKENIPPYSLTGDSPVGNYREWRPAVGTYQLIATPYNGANASGGVACGPDTINFTVIDEECTTLEIQINFYFPPGAYWQLADLSENGVLAQGPVVVSHQVLCLPPTHCYEFSIRDTVGNIFCCSSGYGGMATLTYGGNVLLTGSFGNGGNPTITIACPASIVVNADNAANNTCSASGVILGTPSISDNCGISSTVSNDYPSSSFPLGTTTVTWTAINSAGLTVSCTQTVTVSCNDDDACTLDSCSGNGCLFTPINCDDGLPCTDDVCSDGVCQHSADNERKVVSFTLVDATHDIDISALHDGDVINLAFTGPISVRANVCNDASVESVKFQVNGQTYRIENIAFYSIAGDNNGNYSPWNVQPGVYTIRAIPYSGNNATGAAGIDYSVTITIIDNSALKTGESAVNKIENEKLLLNAYPNPFSDQLNIEFSLAADSPVSLEIFSVTGQRLATLFEGDVKAAQQQTFVYNPAVGCDCMLIYRLRTEQGTYYGKVAMVR